MIKIYQDRIDNLIDKSITDTYICLKEHEAKNSSTVVCEKAVQKIEERYDKKINKLIEKLNNWESKADSYSFCLSPLDGD